MADQALGRPGATVTRPLGPRFRDPHSLLGAGVVVVAGDGAVPAMTGSSAALRAGSPSNANASSPAALNSCARAINSCRSISAAIPGASPKSLVAGGMSFCCKRATMLFRATSAWFG